MPGGVTVESIGEALARLLARAGLAMPSVPVEHGAQKLARPPAVEQAAQEQERAA